MFSLPHTSRLERVQQSPHTETGESLKLEHFQHLAMLLGEINATDRYTKTDAEQLTFLIQLNAYFPLTKVP